MANKICHNCCHFRNTFTNHLNGTWMVSMGTWVRIDPQAKSFSYCVSITKHNDTAFNTLWFLTCTVFAAFQVLETTSLALSYQWIKACAISLIKGASICVPRNPTVPSMWQAVSREIIAAPQPANREILATPRGPISQSLYEALIKICWNLFSIWFLF